MISAVDIELSFTGSAPYIFTYALNNAEPSTVTTSDNPYNLNVSEEGNYEILSVSDAYCANHDLQGYFEIAYTEEVTSIDEENINNDQVNIYPNPANGHFTLEVSPSKPIQGLLNIIIHSTKGEIIYSGSFDPSAISHVSGTYAIDIDLSDAYASGSYIVTINAGNFIGDARLILKH